MVTSSLGIIEYWKDKNLTADWIQNGVSVKIMAPITNENLETARQFSKISEIKHVPADYVGTTIVDGQHIFQFKTISSKKEVLPSESYFENTFYTNDPEYVKKAENMLYGIWNNAQVPSLLTLEAVIQKPLSLGKPANANILDEYKNEYKRIIGFSYISEPQQGRITEKEVLDKIANAKRIPAKDPKRDAIRIYGTEGNAIIYPPKNLNLPNFIIHVSHNNSQSSFGAENSLFIFMQMKIADNQSYIPVAFVTDNPQGYKFRKAMYQVHHTTEVAHLFKKDELKVQTHGDKLFAGWTVPIPLLPPKYVLPPACIMFEGMAK